MKRLFSSLLLAVLASTILVGCSDSDFAKHQAHYKRHNITLYSGGTAVQTWTSTARPENQVNSDGYFFRDAKTGEAISVSGTVVITAQK